MEVITELVAKLPDMEIDGVMSEEMEARVWELRMPDLPQEEQLAVECGYWNNFRFNPEAEKKFTLDSKEPKGDYQEFLNGEVRYNALMRANPEKAQRLFAQNEAEAMERYEYLKGLVNLYDGTAKED